jgi:RNase P subunit RPR2
MCTNGSCQHRRMRLTISVHLKKCANGSMHAWMFGHGLSLKMYAELCSTRLWVWGWAFEWVQPPVLTNSRYLEQITTFLVGSIVTYYHLHTICTDISDDADYQPRSAFELTRLLLPTASTETSIASAASSTDTDADVKFAMRTAMKSFKCRHCDKSFTNRSTLTLHIRSHTGRAAEYACDTCNKRYAQRISLECHRLKHIYVEPLFQSCVAPSIPCPVAQPVSCPFIGVHGFHPLSVDTTRC